MNASAPASARSSAARPMSMPGWYRARCVQMLERTFFGTPPHTTFLSYNWLHRRDLVRVLREEMGTLQGHVADLGAGRRPYRPFISPRVDLYTALDRPEGIGIHDGVADACVGGDLEMLPYADGALDGILCTQVLTHVRDPHRVAREMNRVLCHGGRAIVTTSFTAPIQCEPWDRTRFTPDGMAAMLTDAGFAVERTRPIGGFFAAATICFNTCLLLGNQGGGPRRRRFNLRKWLCAPVVATANLVGALLDRIIPLNRMPIGIVVVVTKPPEASS